MAPQTNPGRYVHRALSSLRGIETADLSTADTRRIEVATMLLSDVSFRAEVGGDRVTDDIETTRLDSGDR